MNSVEIDTQEIQKLIDVNSIETKSDSFFVAAVEHHKPTNRLTTREKWYQKYSLDSGFTNADPVVEKNLFDDIAVGEEVAAIEAVSQGMFAGDIRPKVFDKISQSWTLCDSGSVITCIPRKPEDSIDPSVRLRSVNGGVIPTFGSEEVSVRFGRKTYTIRAIKADIPQRILGWDFFKKYRLGFDWNDFGDLLLTDKKSKSKYLIKCEKIDPQTISAIDSYEEPEITSELSPEMVLFQTECMRLLDETTFAEGTFSDHVSAMTIHPDQSSPIADNIPLSAEVDPDHNKAYQDNLAALQKLPEPYKGLLQKFSILKADFKTEPAKDIYHRIETNGQPFKSKVRPLLASSEKSQLGKKIWAEMEKLGVIERVQQNTTLQYTSPVHLVKKPSGNGWRVCADFRLLNAQTISDNYPLPLLRSFQSNIKGSKIFSKIDLTSAFHHLPIHPDDINKTCVLSPWGGAFVYKRLAFGLTNGPSSWQKYIDGILSGIEDQFCYLDDILVASADVESHLSTLSKIFDRLQENGLTLSLDKCVFGQPTVEYLGYQVSSSGICPLKKKVDAISKIPAPTTQKLLLQFLGALNYFRSSLSGLTKEGNYHNAANLLQPLYSAATTPIPPTKFKEVWSNSPCLQQAFLDAKELLVQAAELAHPDPSLPLALMTDASQHSVGAVLMQRSTTGKWFPLGYMSRHLPIDKVQWSTCRKELLAAQAGLRYFIAEIYGRHCTIFSDHAPLVLAFKNPQGFQLHDPVAQRALMEIGQFTKDVRHIAGLKNTGSDFLSRIPPELRGSAYVENASSSEPSEQKCADIASIEGQRLSCMSSTVIFDAQAECRELELIKAGKHASSVTFQQVEIAGVELWCEMSQSQPRPFLPKPLRTFVMKQMHYAHKGIKESVRLISTHYYWSEMRADITRFVQTCHECQSNKPSKCTPPHYGTFEVPDKRFTHCHLDIVGPMPESEGCKYLLSIVDRTTRLFFALPIAEPSAKTCAQQFLLHYVSLFGVPSACTSDRGANFVSSMFQEMQRNLSIDINHTPVYWPQGNGLLERQHQTLKQSLRAQLLELGQNYQDKWYYYLPWALLGMRTAFNKDLGTSSSELALGTHVQVPGSILQPVDFDEEPNIKKILEKLEFKNNRVAVPTSTQPQKEVEPPPPGVTHVYTKQHNTKGLQSLWYGPLKIKDRPTRSTLSIRVGRNRDNSDRLELRNWADCKPANRRADRADAERPKRGRPPKKPKDQDVISEPEEETTETIAESPNLTNSNDGGNSSRPTRSTRNPAPNYVDTLVASIDFSRPPPSYHPPSTTWTASRRELEVINRSIRGY